MVVGGSGGWWVVVGGGGGVGGWEGGRGLVWSRAQAAKEREGQEDDGDEARREVREGAMATALMVVATQRRRQGVVLPWRDLHAAQAAASAALRPLIHRSMIHCRPIVHTCAARKQSK